MKKPASGEKNGEYRPVGRRKMLALLLLGGGWRGEDRVRGGLRYPLISKSWPAAGLLQLMYEKQ